MVEAVSPPRNNWLRSKGTQFVACPGEVSRRIFLARVGSLAVAPLPNVAKAKPVQTKALKAMAFDIQGTTVDFYQPMLRMGAMVNERKGLQLDWAAISKEWRELYRIGLDAVISGEKPLVTTETIYAQGLDRLLERHGLTSAFTEEEKAEINGLWRRLEPWPDAVEGLTRLRRRYTLSTLSNAGMAKVVAVVKNGGLPFDCVLTAQLAQSFKPSPAVYQLAVDNLGFHSNEIMLVACHKYDLRAAKAFGMQTAFVRRPLEFGPGATPDLSDEPYFDIAADNFVELASKLGA